MEQQMEYKNNEMKRMESVMEVMQQENESQMDIYTTTIEECRVNVQNAQRSTIHERQLIVSLNTRINELQEEGSSLKKQIVEQEHKYNQLKENNIRMQQTINDMEQAYEDKKHSKVQYLESEAATQKETINILERNIGNALKQLETANSTIKTIEEERSVIHVEKARFQIQVEALENTLKQYIESNARLEKVCKILKVRHKITAVGYVYVN